MAIAIALPPQAWGANVVIGVDTTLNTDSTADDYDINVDNVTLTNNANLSLGANDTVDVIGPSTGVTIINNGTISTTANNAIDANVNSDNLTITNSGTISSSGGRGMRVQTSTGISITNNAGASITSVGNAAMNLGGSSGSLTNSGTISSNSQNHSGWITRKHHGFDHHQ